MILPHVKALMMFPFAFAWVLFAEGIAGNPADWSQITALGAVIVVLLFLVIKHLPDVQAKFVSLSETFAKASQGQTEAAVKATSGALSKSAETMAQMQQCFITTLDKMAERYHNDNQTMAAAITELSRTCASGTVMLSRRQHTESETLNPNNES